MLIWPPFGSDFIEHHVRVEFSSTYPFLLVSYRFRGALTLDPLAPAQSKRSFSIWELLLKNVISAFFFFIFCDIWTSFLLLGTRVKTRANKNKKYHSIWVPKVPPKWSFSVFSVFGFGGAPRWSQMVFLVPLGGPKGESQCSQGH